MRLRYLFTVIAAILAAPFVLFWAWSAVEAARLDRAFDALEARKEPLDVAEFEPKPATAEQKEASHLYAQAGKLVEGVSLSSLAPVARMIERLCGSPEPAERDRAVRELESFEAGHATLFDLLDRAARLDASGWDEPDRPRTLDLRTQQLMAFAAVRVARMACGDDPAHAPAALLTMLRAGRMSRPDARRGQAAHSLQSVLSHARPDAATLAALQREFERDADEHALEKALLFNRAQWLSFTHPGVFSDPPAGYQSWRVTPFEAIALRLSRPARDHRTVSELREFDEVFQAIDGPWPQKLDAAARLEKKYPRPRSRASGLMNVMNPYGSHVANSRLQFSIFPFAETLARMRASIGAIAVARWRADHGGAVPRSLGELVPTYIAPPLIDPYSGAELKYVAGAAGYKVYSIGRNRRDDGGAWEQNSDLQWARRGDPLDIGIAVRAIPELP